MKILAFADSHGIKEHFDEIIKDSKDADMIVCAGDISSWGEDLEEWLKYLSENITKPILFVHGNHESGIQAKKLCKKYKILYLHKKSIRKKDYVFFGYGGGGFSERNKDFEKTIQQFYKTIKGNEKVIIVTHGPPYGTKIDFLEGLGHRGDKSMRDIINKKQPDVWICGHIHESSGEVEVVKKTVIINPGPNGRYIKI